MNGDAEHTPRELLEHVANALTISHHTPWDRANVATINGLYVLMPYDGDAVELGETLAEALERLILLAGGFEPMPDTSTPDMFPNLEDRPWN